MLDKKAEWGQSTLELDVEDGAKGGERIYYNDGLFHYFEDSSPEHISFSVKTTTG